MISTPTDHSSLITGFLPSEHGFSFGNVWEDKPWRIRVGEREYAIGLRGRCGGMVFAALDYHRAGVSAAGLAEKRPTAGTPLARYTMWRQLESLSLYGGVNMLRFARWTYRPTGTWIGAATATRREELGNVLVSMVAGRPVPLGLVPAERFKGLGLNHQVVAYGVDRDEAGISIRIYDPNHPLRDDVTLELSWDGTEPIAEKVGGKVRHQWRALFVETYRPKVPPGIEPPGNESALGE
ncbi:MAG: hypothetical protein GWP04_12755 [Gammaproteobacteria bacterium]|nr:hypothetical protein [Gammaproteobacteria bacterium]